jgi:hypothetical protein
MPGASKSSAPDFTGARGPWPTCHWLATVQRCVEPPLSVWGLYHFWSSSVGGPRAFAMLRDARQKPRDPTYRRIERVGEHYGLLVLKVGVLDLAGHLADKAGDAKPTGEA